MHVKAVLLISLLVANAVANSRWPADRECTGLWSNLPNMVGKVSDEKIILMKAMYFGCAKYLDYTQSGSGRDRERDLGQLSRSPLSPVMKINGFADNSDLIRGHSWTNKRTDDERFVGMPI